MKLSDSISSLKGVGAKKEQIFNDHGINTIEDLLSNFPKAYQNRTKITELGFIKPGKNYFVKGIVQSRRYSGNPYKKNVPISFLLSDETGSVEIVFFNGRYLANTINIFQEYVVYGPVTENHGRMQMIHPEMTKVGATDDIRGILPVYKSFSGISSKEIKKYEKQIIDSIENIKDWLPEPIVKKYNIADIKFAYRNIHFPQNKNSILMARFRMVFEELLTLQTGLLYIKSGDLRHEQGIVINCDSDDEFVETLDFELSQGQKRVWNEIKDNLESDRAMNRLLQGDVGSGKTVISEIAMYCCVKSGYQAAIMAPTEILAKQHFASIRKDFDKLDIKVELLTGGMGSAARKNILKRLENGEIDVMIGTHVILNPDVKFNKLGLAVTDEQHRFGVEQRQKLYSKGEKPNIMVMTATPIPRTLAVILYGELDISIIDTMPKGRKPIITKSAKSSQRNSIYRKVKEEINKGHQAYVVAPLIEDSEEIDAKSADYIYKDLTKRFSDKTVAIIHGGMPMAEKDNIMENFSVGNIDILVATVVIEIGINVPNATAMVIENAERFGLAQLHQLRGRVGRGLSESYCFLISDKINDVAEKRIEIMCSSNDGFSIAEEDLNLRGPGEIFGTKQHGLPEMHISDIVRHSKILEQARGAATEILIEDPALTLPKNKLLRNKVEKMFGNDIMLQL